MGRMGGMGRLCRVDRADLVVLEGGNGCSRVHAIFMAREMTKVSPIHGIARLFKEWSCKG